MYSSLLSLETFWSSTGYGFPVFIKSTVILFLWLRFFKNAPFVQVTICTKSLSSLRGYSPFKLFVFWWKTAPKQIILKQPFVWSSYKSVLRSNFVLSGKVFSAGIFTIDGIEILVDWILCQNPFPSNVKEIVLLNFLLTTFPSFSNLRISVFQELDKANSNFFIFLR